jgi:hypothetical protein
MLPPGQQTKFVVADPEVAKVIVVKYNGTTTTAACLMREVKHSNKLISATNKVIASIEKEFKELVLLIKINKKDRDRRKLKEQNPELYEERKRIINEKSSGKTLKSIKLGSKHQYHTLSDKNMMIKRINNFGEFIAGIYVNYIINPIVILADLMWMNVGSDKVGGWHLIFIISGLFLNCYLSSTLLLVLIGFLVGLLIVIYKTNAAERSCPPNEILAILPSITKILVKYCTDYKLLTKLVCIIPTI